MNYKQNKKVMSNKEESNGGSVPTFSIEDYEVWNFRITRMIMAKAEGLDILTDEPPPVPVLPPNPTAQQRRDFEVGIVEVTKWKSAESKGVALIVQSCFSNL